MTEQKLQKHTNQKQMGWYLSRLGGKPGMSSKGMCPVVKGI